MQRARMMHSPAAHIAPRDGTGDSMAGKDAITLDAWNACARQSDMARLLGVAGKSFRDVTRRVFGAYVSHGDALDDRLRAFLYAYHVTAAGNSDARIEIKRAFVDGAPTPPVVK
jgi:hypothetical protein